MGDDFFAAAAPVSRTWPSAMQPGVGASIHLTASSPAAAAAASSFPWPGAVATLGGLLAAVGVYAAWFTVSAQGVSVSFSGMRAHLDGHAVLVLGLVGAAAGVALALVPRRDPIARVLVGVCVAAGLVDLCLTVHGYVRISDVASVLSPFADLLGGHAGPGVGLWLDGLGSVALMAGGIAALVV